MKDRIVNILTSKTFFRLLFPLIITLGAILLASLKVQYLIPFYALFIGIYVLSLVCLLTHEFVIGKINTLACENQVSDNK